MKYIIGRRGHGTGQGLGGSWGLRDPTWVVLSVICIIIVYFVRFFLCFYTWGASRFNQWQNDNTVNHPFFNNTTKGKMWCPNSFLSFVSYRYVHSLTLLQSQPWIESHPSDLTHILLFNHLDPKPRVRILPFYVLLFWIWKVSDWHIWILPSYAENVTRDHVSSWNMGLAIKSKSRPTYSVLSKISGYSLCWVISGEPAISRC